MSIYREYDIRGIYEKELNEASVVRIGYALASKISGEYVAVGYDARSHSPVLFEYLTRGLNAGGKKVLDMGLVPTPVNYFTNYQEWDGVTPSASVMITGSHNPSEYNGFKITVDKAPFFSEDIYALGRECEAMDMPQDVARDVTKIDAVSRYVDYIVDAFSHLKGMDTKIVYDCGNGVAGVVTEDIFSRLELKTKGLFVEPDGTFPNHHPDPSVEHNLEDVKKLLASDGDIAFAYDGDADRIAVLTHKNNIKGDMMALLYSMKMDKPTVIGEVKCSQVMYDELERRGAKAIMYKTGHSNLKVKMRETDADLACEVSGHIFFKNRYFGYDDAIYATLRMLELVHDGIDLDAELAKLPVVYSTEELKVETTEEEKFTIIDRVKELLQNPPADFPTIKDIIDVDGVRINFEKGWGLVRASNTTPVLVTRFESTDAEEAKVYEKAINDLILRAKQKQKMKPKIRYVTKIEKVTEVQNQERLKEVSMKYKFRSNDYYNALIDWSNPEDPIKNIIIPSESELDEHYDKLDASNEQKYMKVQGLEHKYSDTALILFNAVCGGYCRFCFRKRLFIDDNDDLVNDMQEAISYIKEHKEISNVLVTGGDPLVAPSSKLFSLLEDLAAIEHLDFIRIGTKMLAFNPSIFDDATLIEKFQKLNQKKRVKFMNHFNHVNEITPQSIRAVGLLKKAGITLYNQTPIIKGVNDSVEAIRSLLLKLDEIGVISYYFFQMRPTAGNYDYSVAIEDVLDILEEAYQGVAGPLKNVKYIMSHESGKIEIIGRSGDHIVMKYHRSWEKKNHNKTLILKRNTKAHWLDDYEDI